MTKTKYLENLLRVAVYEKELLELEKEHLQKQLDKLKEKEQLRRRILCKP